MPQGFEVIRARIKDDAAILIDRLMRSKHQEIVLVLPKNSIIAANPDSIRILKEEAENIGKILSLNTENREIKSFAEQLGMIVYDPDGRKTELISRVKKIKVMADILPPSFSGALSENNIIHESDDAASEASEITETLETPMPASHSNEVLGGIYETASDNSDLEKNLENFYGAGEAVKNEPVIRRRFYFSLHNLVIFFAIGGFLLLAAAMYLILPEADIKISLKEIPLKAQIPIAVSKNINSPNLVSGIIPGQYFILNRSGSKTMEKSPKIGGSVEIYNAYSVASQKLVAGTRFETKDGKIFRIQNPVVVPGAKMSGSKLIPSSVKAEVVSDTASSEYLIGPSYFTIPGFRSTPKYAGFYAMSSESMKEIENAVASKEEIEKNKKELQEKLAQELKTEILSALGNSDLQLIDDASSIIIDDFKVDSGVLSMKITWQALFFKEKDFKSLINYFVSSHYPDLKNFDFEGKITYPMANRADFKKGELFFTFNIDKNNALPADLDSLKKELIGRDESGMRAVISDKTYINSAAISLWPFWVKKAPNNLGKINITIDN